MIINSSENENEFKDNNKQKKLRSEQNYFIEKEIVKENIKENGEKKKKYQIKSKIFSEDHKKNYEIKKDHLAKSTIDYELERDSDKRPSSLAKKTLSNANMTSSLSKGPILDKLVKRSRSKPHSRFYIPKNSLDSFSDNKDFEKSVFSNEKSDDQKEKQKNLISKEPILSTNPIEKDIINKHIEKSYLEDKTEFINLINNVSVSGIDKKNQNSFHIELNRMDCKDIDESKFDRFIEKTKKDLINKIISPNIDSQPIIYSKNLNLISGFAASTFQNWKKWNEDKINITLNIKLKNNIKSYPVHYFGVFDGHGGSKCAEFLRDNFQKIILEDENFLRAPDEFILLGFNKAEEIIINKNLEQFNKNMDIDRSGSCANLCIVINDIIYIANLGDSRTILCHQDITMISQLTTDHKPNDIKERKRVFNYGGLIYRNQLDSPNNMSTPGVFRIKPGGLAVSRTLGDIEAKLLDFGGKPNVILNIPDIIAFKIDNTLDILIMGTDGIYDKISNKEIIINVIETCIDAINNQNDTDTFLGKAVQNLLKLCVEKDSKDNISCVIIIFDNFMSYFRNKKIDILMKKLSHLRNNEISDNNALVENIVCKRETSDIVMVNNFISNNEKKIIIQNMNNNIQVKKNLKFFCCGLFCNKKKKILYKD